MQKIKDLLDDFLEHRLLSTSALFGFLLVLANYLFPIETHSFVRWMLLDVFKRLIERIVQDDRFIDYVFIGIGGFLVYLKDKK